MKVLTLRLAEEDLFAYVPADAIGYYRKAPDEEGVTLVYLRFGTPGPTILRVSNPVVQISRALTGMLNPSMPPIS